MNGAASEPTIKTPAVKKSRQVGLSGDGSLKEINLIFLWEIKRNVDRVPDDENLYFVLFRRNRRKKPIKTLVRLRVPVDKGSNVYQFRRIACLSFKTGKCFDDTHQPARIRQFEVIQW